MNIKNNKGFGVLSYSMLALSAITVIISSFTTWYLAIHKNTEKEGIYPTGMAIAQDRINDVLNKSFYDNYKKAQNHETVSHIKDGDGNIIYPGDAYDVETIYDDATSCDNQLCYRATVHVKNKADGKTVASASENILESQSGRGIPIGTVIPYSGDLSKIPYGWEIYNKMDDYFSKGAKGDSDLGETGGQKTFVIKPENMPSYEFTFQFDREMANGAYTPQYHPNSFGAQSGTNWADFHAHSVDIKNPNGNSPKFVQFGYLTISVFVNEWKNEPFVMEPSYYKIAYIIKTKEVD